MSSACASRTRTPTCSWRMRTATCGTAVPPPGRATRRSRRRCLRGRITCGWSRGRRAPIGTCSATGSPRPTRMRWPPWRRKRKRRRARTRDKRRPSLSRATRSRWRRTPTAARTGGRWGRCRRRTWRTRRSATAWWGATSRACSSWTRPAASCSTRAGARTSNPARPGSP